MGSTHKISLIRSWISPKTNQPDSYAKICLKSFWAAIFLITVVFGIMTVIFPEISSNIFTHNANVGIAGGLMLLYFALVLGFVPIVILLTLFILALFVGSLLAIIKTFYNWPLARKNLPVTLARLTLQLFIVTIIISVVTNEFSTNPSMFYQNHPLGQMITRVGFLFGYLLLLLYSLISIAVIMWFYNVLILLSLGLSFLTLEIIKHRFSRSFGPISYVFITGIATLVSISFYYDKLSVELVLMCVSLGGFVGLIYYISQNRLILKQIIQRADK